MADPVQNRGAPPHRRQTRKLVFMGGGSHVITDWISQDQDSGGAGRPLDKALWGGLRMLASWLASDVVSVHGRKGGGLVGSQFIKRSLDWTICRPFSYTWASPLLMAISP